MLESFLYYLFSGVVFSFVVDISSWYYERQGNKMPEGTEWDWNTRAIAILIWPLGIIYFLAGFIITVINNNKNK